MSAEPDRSPSEELPRLLQELRASRQDLSRTALPALLVTALGFLIAFCFVEPPPPREIAIAAGPAHGKYYAVATRYAELLEQYGITLDVRETVGSVANYEVLLNDPSVSLAIVQGGTVPDEQGTERLEAIATLYLEPVWVFYRGEAPITTLREMRGKRIAVGDPGSGTRALAKKLLTANGVHDHAEETEYVSAGTARAAELLLQGNVDAALFVLGADSPLVRTLLEDRDIKVMSFARHDAYAQRYPFLESVVLARGVIDFENDLPARDVTLVAPVANLVANRELHDAFVPLLMESATEVHHTGELITGPGEQPSLNGIEFPVHPVARHYLKYGPSFFEEYLGFWIASLIDRAKIMIVPLVILLIPFAKLAPPVYRWRIRSRIYRWYAVLRYIDQTVRTGDANALEACERKLSRMEGELEEVTVPLSFMEEFYHLRLHIDLVKSRLDKQQRRQGDEAAAALVSDDAE